MISSEVISTPLKNVKMEHANTFLPDSSPDVPPGFPPKPPKTSSSATASATATATASATATATVASVESLGNQNPPSKENGSLYMHEQRQSPEFSAVQSQRRTPRKRSRPKFYKPPAPRRPTAEPPKPAAAPPRRRGRPPKARSMSLFSLQETQTRNGYEVSLVTSLRTTKVQSSSQANNPLNGKTRKKQARTIVDKLIDENLAHMIKAIEEKHGDITRGCSLESDSMRTLVVIGICKVVQDLQKKQLKDVDDVSSLDAYYGVVRDGENMNVNVQWLHNRLDEISDAVRLSNEAIGMADEKNRLVKEIDRKKKEVERLKSQVKDVEEELAREVAVVVELNKKLSDHTSKISQFHNTCLMDGIL